MCGLVSRYRDWLRQSERDYASALVNHNSGLYEEACFESHQAAEKAIKAFLNHLGKERRERSLVYLLAELGAQVPVNVKECAIYLDKHYVPSRYPDVYPEGIPADYYTVDDSKKCLECAEKLLNWVKNGVH